jgi:DNA-binding transcriptional MerR regulator
MFYNYYTKFFVKEENFMSTSEFMSATAFAKLCGVTTQTVLNWVSNGTLEPAQRIGNKSFFTREQFVRIQLNDLKRKGVTSYLGVIIADSDEALAVNEANFEKIIKTNLPDAHKIDDIYKFYMDMLDVNPADLTGQALDIYNRKVLDEFCKSVRDGVLSFVKELYIAVPESADFTLTFLLSCIFGEVIDDASLESYSKIKLPDVRYTAEGMKNSVFALYSGLLTKYGILDVCNSLSVKDAYYGNTSSVDVAKLNVNRSAPLAKALYNKSTTSASNAAKSTVIRKTFNNGYYSIVSGVGSLSDGAVDSVLRSLVNNDYMWLYTNNMEALPPHIQSIINTLVSCGKLKLV